MPNNPAQPLGITKAAFQALIAQAQTDHAAALQLAQKAQADEDAAIQIREGRRKDHQNAAAVWINLVAAYELTTGEAVPDQLKPNLP